MTARRRYRNACAALAGAAAGLSLLAGCGGMRPYRAMAKAATSEESAPAQAGDDRLKISLREALVAAAPDTAVHVTPYVYMGHAYLVGFVASDAERQRIIGAAQGVPGVRSVTTYLPPPPASSQTATDLEIEGEVKAALAAAGNRVTQIDLDVLAGQVVLLGVVANQAAIDAAVAAAQGVSGVTGVTNFLLLPEPGYEKRLRAL